MTGRVIAAVRRLAMLGFVVAVAGGVGMGTGVIRPATKLISSTSISLGSRDVGPLYPGTTERLNLVISNPLDHAVTLESVSVVVNDATTSGGAPNPDCNGPANVVVTRNLAVSPAAVVVAAHATSSLADIGIPEDQWPAISMLDLPSNQDACQGAAFSLTYSASY